MPLQFSYAAPWGDAYPSAYAICTTAQWDRASGKIAAHFKVYKDKAAYTAGNSPLLETDVAVGADVSALYDVVDNGALAYFAGAAVVA